MFCFKFRLTNILNEFSSFSNFRNFVLISLKNTYKTYFDLIRGAGGILLAIFGFSAIFLFYLGTFSFLTGEGSFVISSFQLNPINLVLESFFIFIVACAVRSSVGLKNRDYFVENILKSFLIFFLFRVLLSHFEIFFVWISRSEVPILASISGFLLLVLSFHVDLFLSIFVFFLLDSSGGLGFVLGVLRSSFLLFWKNYWVFVLTGGALNLIFFCIYKFINFMGSYFLLLETLSGYSILLNLYSLAIVTLAVLVYWPVYLNFLFSLYLKRIYGDSKLYAVN